MKRNRTGEIGRRQFFRALGGSVTAAAALGSPIGASEAQAYDPGSDETKPRYKADAPDVQAFYRTNGYETLKK